MGRMIDILRTADRRPGADAPIDDEPVDAAEPETVDDVAVVALTPEPPLEDDATVPFIEVGGPREPTLRLVPAPTSNADLPGALAQNLTPRPPSRSGKGENSLESSPPFPLREGGPGGLGASPSNLFTIRFQPVHAARLSGRSPVAELITFHQPDHPVSVQYRSLAAEIARQLPGTSPRVLLFTGSAGGVGTSTVLLNLAITLARQDAKVTVADAHLNRPALAARLGLPAGPGLREVLAGQMPPTWCVQETAHPNLLVLPAGTAGTPREGASLPAILELLRNRSDWVLVDAGPWADGPMAADLSAGGDAVYIVVPQETAAAPETAALQDDILQQTGRLRGCVVTFREP
jgi:Mrp family chromosome partitioning ATPase